jgi:N-glycosylase/DNA lyase
MLSGQTPNFIWHFENGKFSRAWDGRVIEVSQENGKLKTNSKKFVNSLFREKDNYSKIYKKISTDSFMKQAVKDYHGLRLTQSELWEAIACFVLSSNRSIPIIKMNVQELMKNYGARVEGMFEFPKVEGLAKCTEQDFRKSKCGFRDKYLLGTTRKVLQRGDLKFADSQELKEFLLECPGIGEKIAECILLYGFGDASAFPLDVWMKRAISKVYFQGKERKNEDYLVKAEELWGNYKGFAQLYLFYEFMTKKAFW